MLSAHFTIGESEERTSVGAGRSPSPCAPAVRWRSAMGEQSVSGHATEVYRKADSRNVWSVDVCRALRRGRASDSSGGSDRGLDELDSGLDGGLSSSAPTLARADLPAVWMFMCVFRFGSVCFAGDRFGELRTWSQKCSYGRITRAYEFLICVASPGIPP